MAEYYAVERSPEYLAHYGVRGMRWGVRKAIESGNKKALDRHYKKALAKMKKLNTKANISRSQQEYKGRMADAATLGLSGALIAGGGIGLREIARADNKRIIGMAGLIPFDSEKTHYVTTPIGAATGAYGLYNAGKGLAAKYRTTPKGHAKAKQKAKDFQSEMKSAFKGTKYSKLPGANGMNKAYGYEPVGQQVKNAAIDSVVYPGYSRNVKVANEIKGNKPRHRKKR